MRKSVVACLITRALLVRALRHFALQYNLLPWTRNERTSIGRPLAGMRRLLVAMSPRGYPSISAARTAAGNSNT
jgi:hypothetical protein